MSFHRYTSLPLLVLGLTLGNALPIYNTACPDPIATTLNGSYYGIHNPNFNQDFFLGVPFAQPPVGDLRLRQPASLNNTWTGVKNATEYGFACIGYGEDTQIGGNNYVDEDCLTLNIVAPSGWDPSQKLPVAVWIYGGGWYEGTSLDPRYNLSFIVNQSTVIDQPIIGVSINYRLSAYGWLYSNETLKEGVTNLGLRDQRSEFLALSTLRISMAFQWLQDNIEAFGGDKSRVTIWGESAGAGSVGSHLLAYNGRDDGLFHGAIAESGSPLGFTLIEPTPEVSEIVYQNLTQALGCSNATNQLDCLRLVPADVFNAAVNASGNTESDYDVFYGPIPDGDILARNQLSQLQDGAFVKVPYIIGVNSDEGTDFVDFGLNTDEEFDAFWKPFGIDDATYANLTELYPDDPANDIPASHPAAFDETIGTQFKRAATLFTDAVFVAPKRLTAQEWVKHTTVPLYSYHFDTIPHGIPDYFAVTHFQEAMFVFHNVEGQGFPGVSPPYFGEDPFEGEPESYFLLADEMSRRWISFVATGVPDFEGMTGPEWPAYSLDTPQNIVFSANTSVHIEPDTYRQEGVDFLIEKFLEHPSWST
ncbi:Lipase [Lachnellula subtilissima]|uniref:Carboxylic ester hydrolase n=1 Tax=Lachnellula subtilissima TaxID=602034 RepID=A0A8H8RLA1_9HELO|nr:Lipase [Lachnellula subtilissima]